MEKMALRLLVGNEIRAHREAQELTLQDLAEMASSSYTHIWKVERGKVSVGLDLLGRISTALDVPLRDLVDPPERFPSPVAIEYQDITVRGALPEALLPELPDATPPQIKG